MTSLFNTVRKGIAVFLMGAFMLAAACTAVAQPRNNASATQDALRSSSTSVVVLPHSPGLDPSSHQVQPVYKSKRQVESSTRSVPMAGLMSAVVPGAGQVYNKQWVKATISFGLELGLLVGYTVWRQRGLDGRDDYQAYAHAYWDPAQYAAWLNDYRDWLIDTRGRQIQVDPVAIPSGIDFTNPGAWTPAEQASVRALFTHIQRLESDSGIIHPQTGATFSHQLPFFGDQQYYELIGKYFQFAPGWRDYPEWLTNGVPNEAIDPEVENAAGDKIYASDRFFEYARDHGAANDFLRRSSRLSAVFVINHVLSAFDAALSARLHNLKLETSSQLGTSVTGDIQPYASVKLTF